MGNLRRGFFAAIVIGATLMAGCTNEIGANTLPPTPPTEELPTGPLPPIEVALAAPQVRVLNATEYRRTVSDLIGLTVSTNLTQNDWTAGFDNGAGILVDENLLSALVTEAEALGAQYVATRAAVDFACFNVADITDDCMRTLIETLGRRAYRRPLAEDQKTELLAFFNTVSTEVGSRQTGAEMVVARLLTSPQLLYRTEVGNPTTPGGDLYALDDFEKASLLSYTLTGTMPDEELLTDAEAGLLDEAGVRRHIQRLWGAPRTRERVADFFRQWLKVTTLDEMERRPSDYPKLTTPELGSALKREFDAFVAAVVFDGEGTLPALFDSSFSMLDAMTAPLYGLASASDVPERVELDPAERKGVLTLASTMAAIASASDADKDRPVMRGLMIREQLLCTDIGPPSGIDIVAAGQNAAAETPNFDELTTREQYETMMNQGEHCAACHTQFMPLGFTLSHYDGLGRYRTEQRGRPIDASVSDVPFEDDMRDFADGTELSGALARSAETSHCFSTNFARFTTGARHSEHTTTLAGAALQKLGDSPVSIARVVEETLATPALYQRRGVPFTDVDDDDTTPDDDDDTIIPDDDDDDTTLTRSILLASGASLEPDDAVTSQDGAFRLVYQLDGNLVLYRVDGPPLWASDSPGTSPGNTAMQSDGNLVVYDDDGVPRFNTATHGNPGAQLYIDSAGALSIVGTDGTVLWTTGGTP